MREGAKKRLVGAVAIVALAVIFVPMFFEQPPEVPLPSVPESIPPAPRLTEPAKPETFLTPADSGITPAEPAAGEDTGGEEAWSETESLPVSPEGGPGALSAEPPSATPPPASAQATPAKPAATPPVTPEVPTTPPRPARNDGMPSWVVQVASLGTPQSAAELEGRLRQAGFTAFVEKAEVKGKVYYRVRVGPEMDRARAEQTAAQLRKQKLDTLIQRYP